MSKTKCKFNGPVSFLNERSIGSHHQKESVLISKRLEYAKNLFRKDLKGHFGCVNAIEFSTDGGEWIASGGDDMRVLLWNTERAMDDVCKPRAMKGQHHSNIFCLAFDNCNKRIFSGGNDEQVICHDVESGETLDVYMHSDAVYGLSVDPCSDNVFASACDDGRILIYDTRAPPSEDPFCLANYMSAMHAVMFNPVEPRLVATANAKEGLGLWDVRKPRTCLLRYGGSLSQQSCMSVRISRDGNRVIGLRRRLPPVLYNIHSSQALYQFDHAGYYNSCTMKSCCFAGDEDQYIISGSDDFNLYVWKIPDENSDALWVGDANLVLTGHRSIVNQVRFNPSNHLIISSGVEKVVKMWSPYALPNSKGELGIGAPDLYSERAIYSHEEYIHLVLHSGQIMSHDYSNQSTEEDPRMMAFFDSLVQRELENWSSSDESIDSTSGLYDSYVHSRSSRSQSPEHSSATLSDPASVLLPLEVSHGGASSPDRVADESNSREEEPYILDMDMHAADQRLLQNEADREETPAQDAAANTSSNQASTSADTSTSVPMRRRVTIIQSENDTPSNRDSGISEISNTSTDESRRNSISNLIKMKRKEYLEGIKKLEKKALRRRKIMQVWRKEKIKRIKRAARTEYSSSDSSSDTDTSTPCTPVNASSSPDNVAILNEIAAERQSRVQSTERLKRLRARVLHSDNDSDSELPSHSRPKASSSPLNLSMSAEGSDFKPCIPAAVYEDISNDSDEPADNVNGIPNGGQHLATTFHNGVSNNKSIPEDVKNQSDVSEIFNGPGAGEVTDGESDKNSLTGANGSNSLVSRVCDYKTNGTHDVTFELEDAPEKGESSVAKACQNGSCSPADPGGSGSIGCSSSNSCSVSSSHSTSNGCKSADAELLNGKSTPSVSETITDSTMNTDTQFKKPKNKKFNRNYRKQNSNT